MPVTADIDRTHRQALATIIERRREEIERRWLDDVWADGRVRSASITELRDAMPDYLAALAHSLREDESSVESGGAAAWATVAREHAMTRVRLGFDIEQLVREFVTLRRILFEVAREEGLLDKQSHADRLTDLVEAGIAVAVKSYVDARDYAARRVEAEHVGFVTHELRSPLTTAELMSSRLRKTLSLNAPQGREFDLLARSLKRLRKLVDSVLTLEKLGAGEVKVDAVDVTIGELLAAPLEACRALAEERNLRLDVDVLSEALVRADPDLTASVVGNLLDNAAKYTESFIKVVTEDRPGEIAVHVYDNCQGLSHEELRTIFEPFRRGAHRGQPGSGLGLAIARRAARAQGGKIAAESTGERGCHFWFTLPKVRH